jgi:plasmid stabilization system protein ParE
MTHAVRITATALAEIKGALAWLVGRSPVAAVRWHARLLAAIRSLDTHPQRCGLAPENQWWECGELRQLLYGKRHDKYRVLFEVRGDTVYVLRVRHGARDLLRPEELE